MICSLNGEERSCKGCNNKLYVCKAHKVASIVTMLSSLKTVSTELGRKDTIMGKEYAVDKVSMHDEKVSLEKTLSLVNGRDLSVKTKLFSDSDIADVSDVLRSLGVSSSEEKNITETMDKLNSGEIVAVVIKPFTSIKMLNGTNLVSTVKEVEWDIDSKSGDIVQYLKFKVRGEEKCRKVRTDKFGEEFVLNNDRVLRNGHIKCKEAIKFNSRGIIKTVELKGENCNFIVDNTSIYIGVKGNILKIGKITDDKYTINIEVLNKYSEECIDDIREFEKRIEYIAAFSKNILPYGVGEVTEVKMSDR